MFLKGRSASPSLFYTLKNRDMEKQVISPRSITSMPWVLWRVPCKTGSATQGGRRAFHPGTDSSLHEACRGGKLQWSWDLVESRQTNKRDEMVSWRRRESWVWLAQGVTPPALLLALAGEKRAVLMTGLVWEAERRGKRVQIAVKEQQLVRHNSLQEVKERGNTQGRLPWSIAPRTMGRSQKIRERKELVCLTRKKEEKKKKRKWTDCYWSTSMIITRDGFALGNTYLIPAPSTATSVKYDLWERLSPCLNFLGSLNSLCIFGFCFGFFVCLFGFSFFWVLLF